MMSAVGRYKALMESGKIELYGPIPMTEFTVGEIAELMNGGYIYYFSFGHGGEFRSAIPLEEL